MANTTTSVRTAKTDLSNCKDSALLIGFPKEKFEMNAKIRSLDVQFGNILSTFIKNDGFKGEKGEIKNIFVNKNIKNVVLIGLGEENKYSLDVLSNAIADASKRLRDNGSESFSVYLDSFAKNNFSEEEVVEKIALSALIGLYKFNEYKTKDKEKIKVIKAVTLITDSNKNFNNEINYASVVADAVNKTRDLVNTPPNIATPEYVANYARETAKKSNLKCTVLDENQIKKLMMGCFLGVAQGSRQKPKLVILEYNGNKNKKPITIVGKGITFDSGGLNLKPYPFILNMKDDKGGAIAAIHIIEACAKLKLPVNLMVATPLCENMPSGNSFRPDDILTAYNGMTVEIKNTDAEGRLILADALSYVAEKKPQAIIDIATLTGASLIVLGFVGTPFVCTSESLTKKIYDASNKSLEKVWELPLWQEYEESLKSDVADLKHIGDEGEAGVITAAMFLKNFVNDVPWLHIDIGTTVWSKVDKGMLAKGATGAAVRLLMEMLRDWR